MLFFREIHVFISHCCSHHHCWVKSACVSANACVCVCTCVRSSTQPHCGLQQSPGNTTSRGLTWMWGAPTFSLKIAILQLRLRYTTMCQNYARANICDLDPTFKCAPIDRSFALLYFTTSLNANWCRPLPKNLWDMWGVSLLALPCCFHKRFFKYWKVFLFKWILEFTNLWRGVTGLFSPLKIMLNNN